MRTVSDFKALEIQLLNHHEGSWAYFIEVIKYFHQVYDSLDHFRHVEIGGETLIGA